MRLFSLLLCCSINVMFYIKNPGGRIVEFDLPEQRDQWVGQPGFYIPSDEEVRIWLDFKSREREQMRAEANRQSLFNGEGLYFASVTPGGHDGYGIASANIARHMELMGIKISYTFTGQQVGLLFHAPYSVIKMPTQFRILYTMFESTKIPGSWSDYLNAAELIIVPSKWCQKVFKEGGFNTTVVPLGYDDTFFKYHDREIKRDARKNFVFLHYNAFNSRKGFIELVNAFVSEFRHDEPVELWLKTTEKNPPVYFDERKYPNIKVIAGGMPEYQLAKLCADSDCFVFPSKGEGFGQTPLEAMATGMPAIVPNAHGISEYFNPECMYEVEVERMCKAIYRRYKDEDVGQMYDPSVESLRQKMRYVYEHQEEARDKGILAAEYVKQYTFENTAKKLVEIIKDIMGKPLPAKKETNILPLELI